MIFIYVTNKIKLSVSNEHYIKKKAFRFFVDITDNDAVDVNFTLPPLRSF